MVQILRCTIQSFHHHLQLATWDPFPWLLHYQLMVEMLYQVWIDRCLRVVDDRFFDFLFKVNLAFAPIQTAACILNVDLEAVLGFLVLKLLWKLLIGGRIDTSAVKRVGNSKQVGSQVAAVFIRLSRSSELSLSWNVGFLWHSVIWRIVWA